MREGLVSLLNELLVTHSPSGDEKEMEGACTRLLEECCDSVWRDPHDNVVGKIAGHSSDDGKLVLAHKDEIGTIVKRIDEDGKIWMEPLGGCHPWAYGEGPWDILGDEVVTGIMSVGSKHTSGDSPKVMAAKTGPLSWDICYIDCKLDAKELAARGVHVGTRGCVSRLRKTPWYDGDVVGGYALDDKAGVAIMLLAAKLLREGGTAPPQDVYLVATSSEEVGISGGAYAAVHVPATEVIALEIAPVAPEYPISMNDEPVIFYMDAVFLYHKGLADRLCQLGAETGNKCQRILVRSFGSDVSAAVKYGHIGRAGCIGFPTENTHGFELARLGAMENCARLLAAYLGQ